LVKKIYFLGIRITQILGYDLELENLVEKDTENNENCLLCFIIK